MFFAKPGFGVEENVALLKRFNWIEQCLTDMIVTRLNATPEWEVKGGLALQIHLDSQHALAIQNRVAELRHPPHNFHQAPGEKLAAFCQECLRSQNTIETLTVIFKVMRPALLVAYRQHFETTNPLVDQPTRRVLRLAILEEAEAAGNAAFARVMQVRRDADSSNDADWWLELVEHTLGYTPEPLGDEFAAAKDAPWENG